MTSPYTEIVFSDGKKYQPILRITAEDDTVWIDETATREQLCDTIERMAKHIQEAYKLQEQHIGTKGTNEHTNK